MAYMIPDAVPPGRPISERRVFTSLQSLPADCWVYYEPLVAGRYPDFVVLIPDRGLLVLEVKGWRPHVVIGGDAQTIRLTSGTAPNPIRQARDYMVTLMDRCRAHPAAKALLHSDGPHRGRFVFPFGYAAILSEITDQELRHHPAGDLRRILPSRHVVAADQFDAWEGLSESSLTDRLAEFFNPEWEVALTKQQSDALRAIIHPEIVLPPNPNQLATRSLPGQLALPTGEELTLRSLDLEQECLARTIGAGHRLLFGVAGSGKTVVLIARARLLSEALPNGRILVLCFNVPLKCYLAAVLKTCGNVEVFTFHGWGARRNVPRKDENAEEYGARLLDVLQSGHPDGAVYDAVLIDEAQDFDPSWFECVKRVMKEPRNGDLLIVGDRSQTNYRLRQVSWKALGIGAQGRSRILRRNYRNIRPIQVAAAPFSESDEAVDGIAATACEPTSAWRDSGNLPALFKRVSRNAELDMVVEVVRGLLAGRLLSSEFPPLRPEEIGLLYRKDGARSLIEGLVERLSPLAPVVWLNQPRPRAPESNPKEPGLDSRQQVLEPGIKVQTIHSAKGLQYRAVVLLLADQLGSGDHDDVQEDRRLLYVALTRPEDILAVTCSVPVGASPSPLLGELLASDAFRHG